ncbi:SusD/RagB family nutrient-binding outer membrane lipoprotein [Flavihumibacter sp. ZG627]|uniref:SusD/RagB family nutrient-binding outer membrane lipoprotein n=1 Tax=Flavihumibacter sp. ZG627 TaxID=1463156 RepID=UPI00057CEF1C|nr:SusD/RagB family nutrient-binding outer membrane lipoprotein [Flavihumibacter sp. ZG627]KIC89508.1 hypothetical protein HY58_16740 [Flavihumibacter sp. ZG627]
MKNYLIITAITLMTMISCTKDISRFNEEKKLPAVVPAETLFSNGLVNLTTALATPNVNLNVFRFTVQHWAATTYQDEPNYDFFTRNIPQAWWTRMYRDVLSDLKESKKIITATEPGVVSEATLKNQAAIVDLMEVYVYSILVNTFGDVPYSESNDFNNLFPAYDDAKEIYDDLFVRIDNSIASLSTEGEGFSAKADLIYKGDVSSWIKFANTLKMRLAMTVADVDDTAKQKFEEAEENGFTSSADNAAFQFLSASPNTNPIWVDLVQSGRADMVAGKPLLDKMVELNDPRLEAFFDPNNDGKYVGGIIGENNAYATVARPSELIKDPALPHLLLDYVEAEFLRAEAAARGWDVAGTAAEHYANAIRASIIYWGGTEAEATAYLAQPSVAYASAPGEWKAKIGLQKWIALHNRPYIGWVELRRLDFPLLSPPAEPESGFPNRLTYPINEQTLNPDSYASASSAIGGDEVETKLFWDIY